MLYHCDDLNVKILSVQKVENKEGKFFVDGRMHHALAFRLRGNARFVMHSGEEIVSKERNVFYVAQGVGYEVAYTHGETIAIHFQASEYNVPCENYSFVSSEKIYILFDKMLKNWQNKADVMKLKAIFYELLSVLKEESVKDNAIQNEVQKVSAYLEEHFQDFDLTISQACRDCGVSASNLRVKFKRNFGKTPIEYIQELRVEHALRLLSLGELSIEEIAGKSGFSDSKYFARVIKKRFGLSPLKLSKTLFV